MASPRPLFALLTLSALASSCIFSERPPMRVLAIEALDLEAALPTKVSWRVKVRSPDNEYLTGNGIALQGATVRALCHSLKRSLARRGCAITYRDAAPDDPQLARAMSQVVEVPEGWVVWVSDIDADRVDGHMPVVATMRPR